jgi:hypothetical protein
MIPDEEPWWMVRRNAAAIGDGYGGSSQALPCTCPLAAERDDREDTLQALESLNFRPIGYEW